MKLDRFIIARYVFFAKNKKNRIKKIKIKLFLLLSIIASLVATGIENNDYTEASSSNATYVAVPVNRTMPRPNLNEMGNQQAARRVKIIRKNEDEDHYCTICEQIFDKKSQALRHALISHPAAYNP